MSQIITLKRSPKMRIVSEEPRWTEHTPPQGLPFRKREHAPEDVVIVNPMLVKWMKGELR